MHNEGFIVKGNSAFFTLIYSQDAGFCDKVRILY